MVLAARSFRIRAAQERNATSKLLVSTTLSDAEYMVHAEVRLNSRAVSTVLLKLKAVT